MILNPTTLAGQDRISKMIEEYPILLYSEGKEPGFVTNGEPFIFIELVSKEKGIGYLGFHPYKGPLYDGCWFFNLIKVNDSLFTATYYTNDGTDSSVIEFLKEKQIFKIINYKYQTELKLVSDYNSINRIRNIIYATAQYETWRSRQDYINSFSYKKPCYENPLFELPHHKFVEKISDYNTDVQWVNLFCIFKIYPTINVNDKNK